MAGSLMSALAGLLSTTTTAAQPSQATAPDAPALRSSEAMVMLDNQVLRVKGDAPTDLMGFHVYNKATD